MVNLENINIDVDFLENIDKGISKNIDIDKILYQLEFSISNRASVSKPRIVPDPPPDIHNIKPE